MPVTMNATVKATAVLEVVLSITPEGADAATEVALKEGQTLSALTYINNGVEETVSGRIIAFNYQYVKPTTTAACVHLVESTFDKAITPTTMVIDCSKTHESDIRIITLTTIREATVDEGTDDPGTDEPVPPVTQEITNVVLDVDNNMVTFTSTVEVTDVLWNGTAVTPTLVTDTTYDYQLGGVTIEENNTLTVDGVEVVNPSDGTTNFTKPVTP